MPPRPSGLSRRYLPMMSPACMTRIPLQQHFDAAAVVAESADAGHLFRLRRLAGDRLDDAGDDARLELAERATDRLHAGARDAFVDVDVDPVRRHHRHLDGAD